ncbi:MAG: tRNA uridine(34) 5-carboxymethylaminomethyl modification radical SAM/GNAT enzyme Elp3 [Nitrososphaeria archaeon]
MNSIDTHYRKACEKILEAIIKKPVKSKRELYILKSKYAKEFGLSKVPKNSDILSLASGESRKFLQSLLKIKPVRSASGIVVIAVMSRPYPCPQKVPCLYCPGGVAYDSPQSYTGFEPAALRGKEHNYDPYLQVRSRLDQLKSIGHNVQKAEIIIMGGTFLNQPIEYQEYFVKGCFDGLNGKISQSLDEAIKLNEVAEVRNVGLTIETRPDFCKEPHVDLMLKYGVTRVEIGVQILSDRIYKIVERGHTVQDVIDAFRIAKDSGLKIVAHMMPGLPGSSPEEDIESFRTLFEDERFKPDMLKIYPTLVVRNSRLYELYIEGKYVPYPEEVFIDIVAKAMALAPPWLRIMRVQRDIPANLIVAGVKKGNLRELAHARLKELGLSCKCIRCREIGLLELKGEKKIEEDIVLHRTEYKASEGTEVFLSFETADRRALVGFIRLRKPSEKAHRSEVKNSAIVRELHVYGQAVPVGEKTDESWQHRGYGRRLLEEAERITREEFGLDKILVTSAVGVRKYYEKFGYSLMGPYMGKVLKIL